MNFLSSISENAEMSKYLLDWLSYVVSGNRSEHQFANFVGYGRNGKGLVSLLFKTALADYTHSPYVKLITTNHGNIESPSPQVALCRGALLCTLSEPGPGDYLSVGVIKKLSGGEIVTARLLKRNPVTFPFTAAIVVSSNKPLPYQDITEAIALRYILCVFPYVFKDFPDPNNPNEKQNDYGIEERFKEGRYGAQLLRLALENLKKLVSKQRLEEDRLRGKGINTKPLLFKVPESCKLATGNHVRANNPIKDFIKDNIIRERGDVILQKEMIRCFKEWRAEEYPCDTRFKKWDFTDIEAALGKFGVKFYKSSKNRFHGFVIRDNVDDLQYRDNDMALSHSPEPSATHKCDGAIPSKRGDASSSKHGDASSSKRGDASSSKRQRESTW